VRETKLGDDAEIEGSPGLEDDAVTGDGALLAGFSGELTRLLMWIVLAALIVESWLFHRHAVY